MVEFIKEPFPAFINEAAFTVGPGQNYAQAFAAMLAGHLTRRSRWPANLYQLYERNHEDFLTVTSTDRNLWKSGFTASKSMSAKEILAHDWEILPKIHLENPTV